MRHCFASIFTAPACRPISLVSTAAALLFLASIASAEVRLPNVFGDRMVLQCEKPILVWGFADAEEKIAVQFAGQTKSTVADQQGDWSVTLDAVDASFEGRELVVEGPSNRIALADVLLGEVWICGGQSNMEWSLRSTVNADLETESADYPAVRYFKLPHIARPEPQKDILIEGAAEHEGNWRLCMPPAVENCTGVGYYFGVRLHRRLKKPVGLIDTSWGGTMAQHWCNKETLRTIPEMQSYFEDFEAAMKTWVDGGGEDGAKKRYEADLKKWEAARAAAREKGEREPGRPNPKSYTNPGEKRQPAGMYNGMILPLAPLAIRGALFYQGENNSFGESWKPFPKTFPAVIADWRQAFGDDELPFGIIQIAGWSNRRSMTYDMNHHTNIVREIQLLTWQRTPGTGLIVTYDTNSNGSIHPGSKQPVGERSARWALAEVYGTTVPNSTRPIEWRGPVYESMEVDEDKIAISFKEGTANGLRLDQDDDSGFCIAGEDREFHHAQAQIDGRNAVRVWSASVPKPVAVRYSSSNLPVGRLMNSKELPAYPFRTDTWPLVPHQSTGEYKVEEH